MPLTVLSLAFQWATFWTAVSALGSIAAFVATTVYVILMYRLLRRDETPYLRMVRQAVFQQSREFIVTNMGRGIALSCAVVDADGRLLAAAGVVGAGESKEIYTNAPIPETPGFSYFLYYQDISGRWHATKLLPWPGRFKATFLGVVRAKNVPAAAREEAQMISASEMLQSPQPRPNERGRP